MRILIVFTAALALVLSACNQEGKRKKTENGYEYVLHTKAGGRQAQPGDFIYFHAQIRHQDSVVYRTRTQSPEPPFFQIPATQGADAPKPSPIEDVLRLMTLGDSATVFIPLDSLPQKPAGFEDVNEIIYDIVMVDIKSEPEFQELQQEIQAEATARTAEISTKVADIVAQYKSGALKDQIKTTPSGLKYLIYEQGDGPKAEPGMLVTVDYYGVLVEGTMFDNSYERGQAITFPLGQGRVIPGWDEGIALLNQGGKAALFIPADLGYGKAGAPPAIPGDAELIFYVELLSVQSM